MVRLVTGEGQQLSVSQLVGGCVRDQGSVALLLPRPLFRQFIAVVFDENPREGNGVLCPEMLRPSRTFMNPAVPSDIRGVAVQAQAQRRRGMAVRSKGYVKEIPVQSSLGNPERGEHFIAVDPENVASVHLCQQLVSGIGEIMTPLHPVAGNSGDSELLRTPISQAQVHREMVVENGSDGPESVLDMAVAEYANGQGSLKLPGRHSLAWLSGHP
ncbi:hypothetical protein ACFL3Z_00110 [Gemmatimonadota bacterium]